jgi:hypothetical protein
MCDNVKAASRRSIPPSPGGRGKKEFLFTSAGARCRASFVGIVKPVLAGL